LYRFISRFINRVAQRRHVLDLAVLFYTHLAEVTAWLESLRRHLLEDLNFSTGTPSLEDTQVTKVVIAMKFDSFPMQLTLKWMHFLIGGGGNFLTAGVPQICQCLNY
jgi:hypothetical protein